MVKSRWLDTGTVKILMVGCWRVALVFNNELRAKGDADAKFAIRMLLPGFKVRIYFSDEVQAVARATFLTNYWFSAVAEESLPTEVPEEVVSPTEADLIGSF